MGTDQRNFQRSRPVRKNVLAKEVNEKKSRCSTVFFFSCHVLSLFLHFPSFVLHVYLSSNALSILSLKNLWKFFFLRLSQIFGKVASPSSGLWRYYCLILWVKMSFNRTAPSQPDPWCTLPSLFMSQLILSDNAAAKVLISQTSHHVARRDYRHISWC